MIVVDEKDGEIGSSIRFKKKLDHQLLYLQKYKRVVAQISLKFYVQELISIINHLELLV